MAGSLRSRKGRGARREQKLTQLDPELLETAGVVEAEMPPYRGREAQAKVGSFDEAARIFRGDGVSQIAIESIESPNQDGRERMGGWAISKLRPCARALAKGAPSIGPGSAFGRFGEVQKDSIEDIELDGRLGNELGRRMGLVRTYRGENQEHAEEPTNDEPR